MKASFKLPRDFVRSMLASHSILGLSVAALLYLVCVSGTLAVFYPNLERWEQPQVAESSTFDPAALDVAAAAALARESKRPEHLFIALPTDDVPRVAVETEENGNFVRPDGAFAEPVDHEWTHFLVELHYALSLPGVLGLALVGIIGIMMTAMVISGLLAHPNIFKDAFSFRVRGPRRLQQVDIHNRLSVWTSPFQLAIALTGAFIGLSQVYGFVVAGVFFGGDTTAATRSLFLQHDKPTGIEAPLMKVADIVERVQREHPQERPMFVTIHEPGTTAQAVEVGTRVPRRLAWGEFYLYDSQSRYVGDAGWADGDLGVQLYSSTFRLHFGHFVGMWLQVAYIVLGVALCIVIATGVNIWLLRRAQSGRPAPIAQRLWTTTVWGTPLALGVSALADVIADINGAIVFWLALALVLAAGSRISDVARWSYRLRCALAVVSAGVVVAHAIRFGADAFNEAALPVNLLWLALACAAAAMALAGSAKVVASEPERSARVGESALKNL
jgi:uncharacterized iron-regulated membrane protein